MKVSAKNMEVSITKLNHSGDGMGEINKKIVFIPKTIPGDIVEAKIIKEHKNYIEAIPLKYKELSPNRATIQCPCYQECGGCQLMGLSYQEQLNYKKEKVVNILNKYANLDVNPSIKESNLYQYRNKITLQVKYGKIGLYAPNSNTLIPITKCLLVSDNINNIIKLIQDKNINLTNISQIIIREMDNQLMIQFIGKIDESILIKKLSPHITSLYLNNKHLYGTKTITETLGNYQFLISPASFFQVNHNQTINLYNQVKTYLGQNNNEVLDLYCGTGTIGIYVSEYCKEVTGIELNQSSVIDAHNNIKLNNLKNIEIKHGDVGTILDEKNTYDAIIVDPPRSGLDKKTRDTLLKIRSPKLIYISCNPITLARDLNDLKEYYDIKDISLFDMFPNTYHVETAVLLTLKATIHNMKLQKEPFKMINSNKKTIELRLFDEKRQQIKVGDKIIFTNTSNGKTIIRTVLNLHLFDSFDELYQNLPLLACGYTTENIVTASPKDMEKYYSKEEQKKYGVVGIELC